MVNNKSNNFPYEFNYTVDIKTTKILTLISTPAKAELTQDPNRKSARMTCNVAGDELKVFYRCDDMKTPHLIYGINP